VPLGTDAGVAGRRDDQRVFTGLDNPLHIAIVLLVVLMVFGGKRLPELGRSLGLGMREFKDSVTGTTEREALPPAPPTPTDTQPDQAKR
jgi:sec-independent protein translocase protein TatA